MKMYLVKLDFFEVCDNERMFTDSKEYVIVEKSESRVVEKFIKFNNALLMSVTQYDLFTEPKKIKFIMSAYNVNGEVIFVETLPIEVKNTLELIEILKARRSGDYLTVDWKEVDN
ncbi:TPA: hypothetical protein L9968_005100 [Klebsiella aerogenes]|uniref:Uncharacterized protein n=1 Tax=Proteus mirabilis (strain HI4320) TaxID=529507 RepID=B1VJ84_PROMH|nr:MULTISPECIES: hypothetical protein [Enterobacterales]EAW3267797.1 hypothetical protein [Salmonella enterica]KGI83385.1 hypothetical protein JY98_18520 [Exiguobacterium mexicanum]HBS0237582.1 hypothetical protein [Klebsiella aerogenes]APG53515.1 hypothetical protein BGK56_21490 [Providencia stuartii]EEP1426249.1 hypothetical protein [Salmonella enterica]